MQYQETEEERIEEHNKYLDNLDKYCNNCGRIHTGKLIEQHLDGDNKPIEIVICNGPVFIKENKKFRAYEQARAQMIADNIPPDFEEEHRDEEDENTQNTNETPTTEDTKDNEHNKSSE